MKVNVGGIPEHGTRVTAETRVPWARKAAADALEGTAEHLEFDVQLSQIAECVHVVGSLTATVESTCHRCGDPVNIHLEGKVDLFYAPEGSGSAAEGDVALSVTDMDIGWFEDGQIDMAQVVSEQLALWLPERIVCNEPSIQRIDNGQCTLPEQDPGPDLKKTSPFAGIQILDES